MRVVTFNIRNGRSDDGPRSWPFRSAAVCSLIQKLQPDILCLQEAYRYQVDEIAAALPNHNWYGVGRNDGKDEGEFVPIFISRGSVSSPAPPKNSSSSETSLETEILQANYAKPLPGGEVGKARTGKGANRPLGNLGIESGTFWLSTSPDIPGSRSWNSACKRICTWVELAGMRVYNAHLDHESEEARLEGLKLIAKHVQSQETPALVCGDFNAKTEDAPIKFLKNEGFVDLAEGRGDTFNAFMLDPNLIERIDYVFGYKMSNPSNAWVEREPLVSDHWPVIVDLE